MVSGEGIFVHRSLRSQKLTIFAHFSSYLVSQRQIILYRPTDVQTNYILNKICMRLLHSPTVFLELVGNGGEVGAADVL